MAGGGPKKTIEWGAVGIAFQLFVLLVGGLMAYAYMNGGITTRVQSNERRIEALERAVERLVSRPQ